MATYTETIELVDNVSGPAKAAADGVSLLGKGLRAVQSTLVKFGTDAGTAATDKFTDALGRLTPLLEKIGGVGTVRLPKIQTDGADKFGEYVDTLQRLLPVLERLKAIGPVAMPKVKTGAAPALAAAPAAAPSAKAGPTLAPTKTGTPIKLEADTVTAVQQYKTLAASVKSAENTMVKAAAVGDKAAFAKAAASVDQYKAALELLPASAAKAAGGEKSLSKSMWDARNAMDVGRQSVGAAIDAMKSSFASLAQGDAKGVIEGVTQSIASMSKMLNLVVPGLGEAVAAVVSIAGGFAGALASITVGGAKFAIASSNAKAASIAMFDALGQGKIKGEAVDEMLDELRGSLGITKDKMEPLVKQFMALGITGEDELKRLTTAAITAQAQMKDPAAAQAFVDLQTKIRSVADTGQALKIPAKGLGSLAAMGISAGEVAKKLGMTAEELGAQLSAGLDAKRAKQFGDALTDAITKKGKGALETMASSMSSLTELWDELKGDLFEDLTPAIKPFIAEMKKLLGIFDTAKPSGEALKTGIGAFFTEVFGIATKLVPVVRSFLLDLVIYGLKAYIALKPIAKSIREFFESATGSALLKNLLDGIVAVLGAVGVAIGVVVGIAAIFIGLMVTMNALFGAAIGWVLNFGVTITNTLVGAIQSLINWVAQAPQQALNFVMGLVTGITSGGGMVAEAVKGLAGGALNAFKGVLGINSPSRVMMGLGGFTAAGFAEGMDAGAPDIHGVASSMASAAVTGAAAAPPLSPAVAASATAAQAAGGGTGGGGQVVINLEPGAIQISGQGKDWSEITEEMIAGVMERLGMQAGVA